jgi:ParB/RepB/Spo0J family partition protein
MTTTQTTESTKSRKPSAKNGKANNPPDDETSATESSLSHSTGFDPASLGAQLIDSWEEYKKATKGVGPEFIVTDPKKLIVLPIDVRAHPAIADDTFLQSINDKGVATPILVSPAWKDGVLVYVICAGHRRVEGAIKCNLTEVKCAVKPRSLSELLDDAYTENTQRKAMTAYDKACYYRLRLAIDGITQTELAKRCGVANATITQHLDIFKLSPEVQKQVDLGKFEPNTMTKVRALGRLKDLDVQTQVARKGIEEEWIPKVYEREVQLTIQKQEAQAKRDAEKATRSSSPSESKKKGTPKETEAAESTTEEPKYTSANVNLLGKRVAASLLNRADEALAKLRSKDADKEKVAFARGRIKGLEEAFGFCELPKGIEE